MKIKKSKNEKLVKLAKEFRPWDYGFNLEIEREMFKKMYKYFSSDKPVTDKVVAKYIKLAINLLTIIMEDDRSAQFRNNEWIGTKYINTRNSKRFVNFEVNCPIREDYLRIEKAWHLYNKLRFYKMRVMWD